MTTCANCMNADARQATPHSSSGEARTAGDKYFLTVRESRAYRLVLKEHANFLIKSFNTRLFFGGESKN